MKTLLKISIFMVIALSGLSLMALSYSPMVILTVLVATTFFSAKPLMIISFSSWASTLIVLIFAGGMLVLFLFLVAMTPNSQVGKTKYGILIFPVFVYFFGGCLISSKESVSLSAFFFTESWTTLLFVITLLVVIMILVASVLYNPKASLKSTILT